MKYKYIHYNENDTLNGIFAYLNEYYPQLFVVFCSTHETVSTTNPRDVTRRNRPTSYRYWASDNDPEMVISFLHPILLTSYTIENAQAGNSWMMNWTVSGSNDLTNWEIIDQREGEIVCENYWSNYNNGFICSERKNASYFVNNPKFFSHIKIKNDQNSINQKYIIMRSLEFHGLTTFFPLCTVIRKMFAPHLISSYIAILLP